MKYGLTLTVIILEKELNSEFMSTFERIMEYAHKQLVFYNRKYRCPRIAESNSRDNSEPEMSYTWFRIAAVGEWAAVEAWEMCPGVGVLL
jgi:hypothetical protein